MFQCPYCDHEPYATQGALTRHLNSKHPDAEAAVAEETGNVDPTAPAADAASYPELPEGLTQEAYQLLVRARGKDEADRLVAEMVPPAPPEEAAPLTDSERIARLEEALTHWFRGEQYMALEALGVSK